MQIRKLVHIGRRSAMATFSLALLLALISGCPGVPPTDGGGTGGSGGGGTGGGVDDPGAGSPARVDVTTAGLGTIDQSDDGNLVTLTAVAADGFEFAGWSGAVETDENPLTVDITEVPELSATFRPIPPPAPDADDDGVPDATDNCVNAANPDQSDSDEDGFGDACDNCPDRRNPSQSDADGDGIATACDNCPAIANADQTDSNGDGTGDACEGDRDDDSVPDDDDNCIAVANADQADADGDGLGDVCDNCPNDANADQTDADNDDLGDSCDLCPNDADNDADRDAVCGDVDTCPNTAPRVQVDADGCELIPGGGGTTPICGNATVEAGEQCDDGNTADGDGCSASCQVEPGGLANDNCDSPTTVTDGATPFNNLGATDDGPNEPGMCTFFGDARIQSDVWFGYTASCSGEVVLSLCGGDFDSKMAVYAGNACPTAEPAACSDDDCGPGATDARVTFQAVAGEQYLIRIGGFEGAQGDGTLSIRCGVDVCAAAAGDCFAEHGNAGCSDATCCNTTCDTDPFCCDVTWDSFCAGEAAGLCTGSFPACVAGAGACDEAHDTDMKGCDGVDCCNTVCMDDPFCCITEWDDICAANATGVCGLTCGAGSGSCFLTNGSAGCEDTTCCQDVCVDNPFCCDTTWDQACIDDATAICR